jgi:hypothetical protein
LTDRCLHGLLGSNGTIVLLALSTPSIGMMDALTVGVIVSGSKLTAAQGHPSRWPFLVSPQKPDQALVVS